MEGRLLGAILDGNGKAMFVAMDDIHHWLVTRSRSVRELRAWVSEFFVVVRYSLSRRLPGTPVDGARLVHDLSKAHRAQDIRIATRTHLLDLLAVSGAASSRLLPNTVRRIQEFIDTHYSEECTLDVLAVNISQSASHLSRLFKRHTGRNIVEYVNVMRVARAKQLLATGRFTVKQVSLKVGYADPGYFARVFRRLEGVSPSFFRNRVAVSTTPDS